MKYEICYVEEQTYYIEVQADSEEEAKEKAYEICEDREKLKEFFDDDDGRIVTVCEEEE